MYFKKSFQMAFSVFGTEPRQSRRVPQFHLRLKLSPLSLRCRICRITSPCLLQIANKKHKWMTKTAQVVFFFQFFSFLLLKKTPVKTNKHQKKQRQQVPVWKEMKHSAITMIGTKNKLTISRSWLLVSFEEWLWKRWSMSEMKKYVVEGGL